MRKKLERLQTELSIRLWIHKNFGSFDITKPCQLSFLSEHIFSCVNLFQCRCVQVTVDTFLDIVWNIYVFWFVWRNAGKQDILKVHRLEFSAFYNNLDLNHYKKYVSAGDVPYPACSLPSPPKLPRNNNFRLVSILTLGSLINGYTCLLLSTRNSNLSSNFHVINWKCLLT